MTQATGASAPTTSLYAKYAAPAAQSYERHFVPDIGEPMARRLIAAARPQPGERVLDVACGTGVAARLADEAVGPGGAVAGLDPNPGMLAVARAISPARIAWHEAAAEDVPLPDASFDLVLCSMGLQFFADRAGALREAHRVLVPGGRLAWCTPGPTPALFEALDAALAAHVGPGASMFVSAVFSLHDSGEARALTEAAGFDQVQVEAATARLRLDTPADFFWQYVASTPLAAMAAVLDDPARAALEEDVVARCAPFTDGGTTLLEARLLLVTASRG